MSQSSVVEQERARAVPYDAEPARRTDEPRAVQVKTVTVEAPVATRRRNVGGLLMV